MDTTITSASPNLTESPRRQPLAPKSVNTLPLPSPRKLGSDLDKITELVSPLKQTQIQKPAPIPIATTDVVHVPSRKRARSLLASDTCADITTATVGDVSDALVEPSRKHVRLASADAGDVVQPEAEQPASASQNGVSRLIEASKPLLDSQQSFSSLIDYNPASSSGSAPCSSPPPQLPRQTSEISASEALRLRLRMAMYKIQTNQVSIPMEQLRITSTTTTTPRPSEQQTAQLRPISSSYHHSNKIDQLLDRLLSSPKYAMMHPETRAEWNIPTPRHTPGRTARRAPRPHLHPAPSSPPVSGSSSDCSDFEACQLDCEVEARPLGKSVAGVDSTRRDNQYSEHHRHQHTHQRQHYEHSKPNQHHDRALDIHTGNGTRVMSSTPLLPRHRDVTAYAVEQQSPSLALTSSAIKGRAAGQLLDLVRAA